MCKQVFQVCHTIQWPHSQTWTIIFNFSPSTFTHKRGSQFKFSRWKPRTPTSFDNPSEFMATPPNSQSNWIDNDNHRPSLPFSLINLLEMGTTCSGSLWICKTPMRIQCSNNVTPKFSSHRICKLSCESGPGTTYLQCHTSEPCSKLHFTLTIDSFREFQIWHQTAGIPRYVQGSPT